LLNLRKFHTSSYKETPALDVSLFSQRGKFWTSIHFITKWRSLFPASYSGTFVRNALWLSLQRLT